MVKINAGQSFPGKVLRKPRILVAPLDWGLGHTTRCIPVIYALLAHGAEVWLAADGPQKVLLEKEFPGLPFLTLEGYNVRYSRSPWSFFRTMIAQLPRIALTIRKEHRWLKNAVLQYRFDAVISDNRFGLYHPRIPSVFITHQLMVKSPVGSWAERLFQRINYSYINRFSVCWIPDQEEKAIAGDLSHPSKLPGIPVHYVGLLSRLKKLDIPIKKNHLFISLSGPEPQRSLFEDMIIHQISQYGGTATVVRGLPGYQSLIPSTNQIKFFNHLPAEEYSLAMQEADLVISRSGYSTVMDIVRLQKKSVLVPTPGQTEQEYLAMHLEQLNMAGWVKQKDFLLKDVTEKAKGFDYDLFISEENKLNKTVHEFVNVLSSSF